MPYRFTFRQLCTVGHVLTLITFRRVLCFLINHLCSFYDEKVHNVPLLTFLFGQKQSKLRTRLQELKRKHDAKNLFSCSYFMHRHQKTRQTTICQNPTTIKSLQQLKLENGWLGKMCSIVLGTRKVMNLVSSHLQAVCDEVKRVMSSCHFCSVSIIVIHVHLAFATPIQVWMPGPSKALPRKI